MAVVAGGGSSFPPRNRMRQHDLQPQKEMYIPSIYRYSCHGAFSVSTDTPGSVGTCHGIRSQLDHLLDLDVATRQDAIRQFVSPSSGAEEEFLEGEKDALGNSAAGNHHKADNSDVKLLEESREINPALIYPRSAQAQQRELLQSPASKSNIQSLQNIKEDEDEEHFEFTTRVVREAWNAYGSTEVECLQLTSLKDGSTEIVAVAPYNHGLVSYRQVEFAPQHGSLTSLYIGFAYKVGLNFETGPASEEELQQQQQQQQATKERGAEQQRPEDEAATLSKNQNATTTRRPVAPTEAATRVAAFSTKLLQNMYWNGIWVHNTVTDESMIPRTVDLGKRIVVYMPKLVVSTTQYMRRFFYGSDDNDDDHNGGPSPPPNTA